MRRCQGAARQGRGPDDLPFVTGSLGLLGTKPSWDLMKGCDTLLMVGSAFPIASFSPNPGRRAASRSISTAPGSVCAIRWKSTWWATARRHCARSLPMLKQKTDTTWLREIERAGRWWKLLEARAMNDADPLNPQRVFWELSPRLPDNAIITGDSGSVANWYARDIKMRRGMKARSPAALPRSAPAPLRGGREIGVSGSHGHCLHGRRSYADERPQCHDHDLQILEAVVQSTLVVLVLNNRDLNQVTWEERVQLGEGKTESTQSIPDFPYHKYAELIGLKGIFVNFPEQVGAAWDEALSADRPVSWRLIPIRTCRRCRRILRSRTPRILCS